jgi:hypothetical protein
VGEFRGLRSYRALEGGVGEGDGGVGVLQIVLLEVLLIVVQFLGMALRQVGLLLRTARAFLPLLVQVIVYVERFLHGL